MNYLCIVGAQRSGSTYLYQVLDSHPQVSMVHPVRPEPKFFMNESLVAKGRKYYQEAYFSDCKPGALYFGEKSTSYIENPMAARRIKDFYPNARVLMILRDPVARAYSNYRFSVAHQLEDLTFDGALAIERQRLRTGAFSTSVSPYAYRQRGHYMNYIEPYLEIFDSRQISVLIFEEFVNSLESIRNLYRWLGIDDGHLPRSLNEVVNQATTPKEDQKAALRDLALGYRESIARLEDWLGRRIDVWHEHHLRILEGAWP